MPECEICGKRVAVVYEIDLDGSQMLVCEACARGRKVAQTFGPTGKDEEKSKPVAIKSTQEELIENYGDVIRKAREKLGLPLRVLAEKISEKESNLLRIEKQKTLPNEKTRQKLEKELGIKLTSKETDSKSFLASKKNEPVTLWDLTKQKKDQGE